MTIQITCDECGKGYRIPDEKAGKKMRCRQCETVIQIPDLEEEYDEYAEDDYGDDDDGYEDEYAAPPPRRRKATSSKSRKSKSKSGSNNRLIIAAASGGVLLVVGIAAAVFLFSDAGVDEVEPLATGDSVAESSDPPADSVAGVTPGNPATRPAVGSPAQPGTGMSASTGPGMPGGPTQSGAVSPSMARLPEVKSKLKQIMLALHNHHDTHRMFNPDTLAPAHYAEDGRPLLSWRVHILPFMDEVELFREFKLDEAWDSPHNKPLLARMPDMYRSPGDAADSSQTRFRGVESMVASPKTRLTTMFTMAPGGRMIRMRDVIDGTSNTVMFIEAAADKAVEWTKPEELTLVPDDPASAFGRIDPIGVPAAIADGSVKLIPSDLPPQVWANLINPADGQMVPNDAFTAIPDRPVPTFNFTPRTDVPLHLAYLTKDTIGVVVVQPGEMLQSAQVKDMLTEMSSAGAMPPGMLEVLENLETVVAWVTPGDRRAPAHMALRFRTPSTLEAVAQMIHAKPEEIRQHDSRTWLMASPEFPAKLAAAASSQSSLAATLQDMDLDRHVVARFDMQKAFQQVPQLAMVTASPQMNGLKQIQQIDASLDWSGDSLLNVRARTSSAAIAQLLNDQLQQALQTELPPNAPPQMKITVNALQALLTAGIDPGREDTIQLSLKNSPELATTVLTPLREATTQARAAATRVQQKNNLKQVGLAMHNYHDVFGQFPLAKNPKWLDSQGKPYLSWRVHLLPFLNQAPLYQNFRLEEAWNSPHNMALLDQMPAVFKVDGVSKPGHTSLMTFSGPGSGFPESVGPAIRDIRDGSSNTIAAVQAGPDKAVPWTQPVDLLVDTENALAPLGRVGPGFNTLYFDGSVKFVSSTITPGELLRQINPNDGR